MAMLLVWLSLSLGWVWSKTGGLGAELGKSELRIVVFSHATRVSWVQGMHRGECCPWRFQLDVGLDLCTRSWVGRGGGGES
jgi:hypothetical protein